MKKASLYQLAFFIELTVGREDRMDSLEGYNEGEPRDISKPNWLEKSQESDASHKRWGRSGIIIVMTLLVLLMNLAVVILIFYVSNQELELVEKKIMDASLRVIDAKVYLALITGTVAEVSALFLIIVKSLFKDA